MKLTPGVTKQIDQKDKKCLICKECSFVKNIMTKKKTKWQKKTKMYPFLPFNT